MGHPLTLRLTPEQVAELVRLRDTAPKPHTRERAAALLKVAAGMSAKAVAAGGLLKVRREETVAGWVHRFRERGADGLAIRPGRGRKPAFSPRHPTAQAAAAEVLEVVHRSPRLRGRDRSRWWLDGLRQAVDWMAGLSPGGVHRLLRRLGVRYKRGRRYVHSPDPLDDEKMAALRAAIAESSKDPTRCAFLYEDEFTSYRRPTAAHAYAAAGADDPRVDQGHGNNSKRRVLGSLDIRTGKLITWQRSGTGRDVLIRYFREVASHYPDAEVVYIALDNWPVHFHPDVEAALAGTKVKLLRLPTYAPWTNPVEKVWRWLFHEVLHHHAFRDDWGRLKEVVTAWLEKWKDGSPDLLRYVGLNPG